MTIKEITALRKAGRLDEALSEAEQEYSVRANRYTGGAVFWCLYDLYKQQTGPQADATFERMKQLAEQYAEEDELMLGALAKVERQRLAHSQELKDAIERAKTADRPMPSYDDFVRYYNAGELEPQLFSDFGWLIYYTLKNTPLNEAYRRKCMLAQYLRLDLQRPSILHSLMLSEAVKVEQNTPLQFSMRDFIRLWGIENLRQDDWAQYRTDEGFVALSLVEKLIGVYAKELKTDKVVADDDMAQLVDQALERYPNSQNMPYFKATVLLSQGRTEEALAYYRRLILRFPTKFYLWHQASMLVADLDTKIGLLCKALAACGDEAFLGSVHLALANALIYKGLYGNAKTELDKYHQTYQERGWRPKTEYYEINSRVPAQTSAADNAALYQQYTTYADEFIYSDLPGAIVVKVADQKLDDRMHPGRTFVQWTLKGEKEIYRLQKPAKHGLSNQAPNGSIFEIKIYNKKIVRIKTLEHRPQVPWIKEASGTLTLRTDRKGKPYAIIEGVYVPEKLIKNLRDGQAVKLLAIRQDDARWQALAISKQ